MDHLGALLEPGHALVDRPQVHPVGIGFERVPACPQAQLETPLGDDVQG